MVVVQVFIVLPVVVQVFVVVPWGIDDTGLFWFVDELVVVEELEAFV